MPYAPLPTALTAARAQLEEIQSRLLDVGSAVATPPDGASQHRRERVTFDSGATARLEAWIDAMDEELPQLRNFILPSGAAGQREKSEVRSYAIHMDCMPPRAYTALSPLHRMMIIGLCLRCWQRMSTTHPSQLSR